jgi:hypothetical protein
MPIFDFTPNQTREPDPEYIEKLVREINRNKPPRLKPAPLRKVIGHIEIEAGYSEDLCGMLYYNHELLECFHHQAQKQDIYGPTNAARRRCLQCQKEEQALQNVLTLSHVGE